MVVQYMFHLDWGGSTWGHSARDPYFFVEPKLQIFRSEILQAGRIIDNYILDIVFQILLNLSNRLFESFKIPSSM